MRKRLFEIIEADDPADGLDKASTAYDILMIALVVLSLLPLTMKEDTPVFTLVEQITVVIFSFDYLLRWATADCKYGTKNVVAFLRYPFSPMAIIDLLSILPSLLTIHPAFRLLRVMRLLRALRVLRVAKVLRYSSSLRILSAVLRDSQKPVKLDDTGEPVRFDTDRSAPPEQSPAPQKPEQKPMTEKEAPIMAIGLLVLAIVIIVLRIGWAIE